MIDRRKNKSNNMGQMSIFVQFFVIFLIFGSVGWTNARRQSVEEVTKRQLDSLLKSEDYLAVFWCK